MQLTFDCYSESIYHAVSLANDSEPRPKVNGEAATMARVEKPSPLGRLASTRRGCKSEMRRPQHTRAHFSLLGKLVRTVFQPAEALCVDKVQQTKLKSNVHRSGMLLTSAVAFTGVGTGMRKGTCNPSPHPNCSIASPSPDVMKHVFDTHGRGDCVSMKVKCQEPVRLDLIACYIN